MTEAQANRKRLVRFIVTAGSLMALLYALLYFPYAADSAPVRFLSGYLELIAKGSGFFIGLWDPTARVEGSAIRGRFPMQIVLDCAALDAQALFVATVAAFPAPTLLRLLGIAVGLVVITCGNLARIVALYFIGLLRPSVFHFWHEEVFQFLIVALAVGAFAAWALWTRRAAPRPAHAA